ncbi:uncharacterized protein CANTADRAFT_33361, partial [Suhomyces tanzawaensis NRRL Y-17324]
NNQNREAPNNNDDSGSESTPNRPREPQAERGSSSSNSSSSNVHRHRADAGIFERFMDNFLGIHRYQHRTGQEGDIESASGNTLSASTSETPNASNPSSGETTNPNTSSANPASANPAAGSASSGTDYDDRAIIITVNYVFSDENNPQDPNRTGSLIMSLPNNSSNRDPRVIQEFIRLATQMAYSSIINGLHKEKGVTLSKFNSFPGVEEKDLGEVQNCSICFEKFEKLVVSPEPSDDEVITKKRRTDSGLTSTATLDNEREDSSTNTTTDPKYLVDYRGTFEHIAVKMPCNHVFGKDCLFEWLKLHTTCPLCRSSVAEPGSNEGNVSTFDLPVNGVEGLSNSNLRVVNNDTTPMSGIDSSGLRRVLRSGSALPEEDEGENNALSSIIGYLRRQRNGVTPPEPLFPTGMSSRRTERGIETRSTEDSNDEVLDFMNL